MLKETASSQARTFLMESTTGLYDRDLTEKQKLPADREFLACQHLKIVGTYAKKAWGKAMAIQTALTLRQRVKMQVDAWFPYSLTNSNKQIL